MTDCNESQANRERIRRQASLLLADFENELLNDDLRVKVISLVPVFHELRKLGKSLLPVALSTAARDRILYYLKKYQGMVIHGDEIMVVSGIQEYARRIRELRVQFGWEIMSGIAVNDMSKAGEEEIPEELSSMKPNEYVLMIPEPDREAAHRWNTANAIRKGGGAVRDKILKFLRQNVGREVTNEELRYVAGNKTEWARRVRELRTEFGWPIASKSTGLPDLRVGVYVLQADRQSYEHDRSIPDPVRREVLRRDKYACQRCDWSHQEWNPDDPRHLELHHVVHHAAGGENTEYNLITLCTICHDQEHKH